MGRLRDDYEIPLFRDITEEVVDLYGVDDAYLFRFWSADNLTDRDPLWGEPATGAVKYKKYPIKCMFLDFQQDPNPTAEGQHEQATNAIYVSMNHIVKAQVPKDHTGEYITEQDVIRIHYKGDTIFYFVVKATRDGFLNDSDKFTGYNLAVNRNNKYVPERELLE